MYNKYIIVLSSVLAVYFYSMQGNISREIAAPGFVSTCSCTQCLHEYILTAITFGVHVCSTIDYILWYHSAYVLYVEELSLFTIVSCIHTLTVLIAEHDCMHVLLARWHSMISQILGSTVILK